MDRNAKGPFDSPALNYFRRRWNSLFISPTQHGNICTSPFVSHKAGLVQDKLLALIRGIGSILTSTPTHVLSAVLSMKGTFALEGI